MAEIVDSDDDLVLAADPTRGPAQERLLIIPDLHGNAGVFEQTLIEADCITVDRDAWTLTDEGWETRIVQLGDVPNRRRRSLEIWERILELRANGALIDTIAGDHEIITMAAADGLDVASHELWTLPQNGGMQLLYELREHMQREHLQRARSGTALESKEPTMPQILGYARHLLLGKRSEIAKLLAGLKLVGHYGSVLCLHSGLDVLGTDIFDREGEAGLNAILTNALMNHEYGKFISGVYKNMLWMRHNTASIMTAERARILAHKGVQLVVRGHDFVIDEEHNALLQGQLIENVDTLHLIHSDIGTWKNVDEPGYAFVKVLSDGRVIVASSVAAQRTFRLGDPTPVQGVRTRERWQNAEEDDDTAVTMD